MREKDEKIFQSYLRVLPTINALTCNDVGVSLTDLDKYLLYMPGESLNLKVKAGDAVKYCLPRQGKKRRIVMRVDKALFGQPCIAVAMPLFNDDGELIGAVSMQETVDRQETLGETDHLKLQKM